jgi:hypothetical protein
MAPVKAFAALIASMALAAPAAAAPCLTPREAETIALVALPEIVRETGRICAGRLPASSLIRRGAGPFLAKYQAAADAAWPDARIAIAKLSDPAVSMLLASDYARPVLTSLLVPLLVGRINTNDCGTIDRLTTLLEPLPPRNTAGVVVTTLQFLRAEKAKGVAAAAGVPDLPVCTR